MNSSVYAQIEKSISSVKEAVSVRKELLSSGQDVKELLGFKSVNTNFIVQDISTTG